LGERECSVQRRRQKLIEESPAPGLSEDQRAFISDAAVRLGRALGYRSLGTVEFLLDSAGRFHFIEINPRIQVEHPVTEMVTGLDLVKAQLQLAAGEPLSFAQDQISPQGWAIEARVLAENPVEGFLPTTGEITYLKEPGGPGIRVDSALYQGMRVTSDYDSLLAKVIGWGETRREALARLRRALQEVQIGGVVTDIGFLLQVLESSRFVAGEIDTTFLDQLPCQPRPGATLARQVAAAAAFLAHRRQSPGDERSDSRWRATAWQEQM
ncbi:MAG: acetyl-CoA carboxylase biotin carboxylase subunit, partial [Anaerolineae bacterium]